MKTLNILVLFANGVTTRVNKTIEQTSNIEDYVHSMIVRLSKNNPNPIVEYNYNLV